MGKTGIRNGGSASQPSRRLAAIMFTDLVGYSALAHRDEALAIELLALHRGWIREILPRFQGKEIETVGDAFLIEFAGALAAVECARAIQDRFADHNATAPDARRMQLRIGIHVGDIEHEGGKVMGDGVNIASRIHEMAAPGGICVSEDVHHALRNRAGLAFESLGRPQLKNISSSLELFRIAPAAGSGQAAPPPSPGAGLRTPRWLPAGAAAAVVVTLAGAWYATRPTAPSGPPSVAVLPFENLSAEADSAYFTDGLHDTVIGHLSRVSGLKVISRTSVMGYRDKRPKLRDVALELGVGHIVEGSVQRAGGRLRVAAQLIDAATDAHLWSNEYDRELADVFAVQADIAKSVAAAVHAKLTPQEQASIDVVPTKNQAAYDLYLRAVLLVARSAVITADQIREAVAWLDEAVRLDPSFAKAYALLANLHTEAYWLGYDPSDERRRLADRNAEMALKLEPGLAEAHIAKAYRQYSARNYELAVRELKIAQGIAPGNAHAHYLLALIHRRQGLWDEATSSFERAIGLDPLNPEILEDYAFTLRMLRRYAESEVAYEHLLRLDPESTSVRQDAAYVSFLRSGDLAPMRRVLDQFPAGVDPGCRVSMTRAYVSVLERRLSDSVVAAEACKQPYVPYGASQQVPKEFMVAFYRWRATGRQPAEADRAQALLEATLAARPDQARVRIALAFTLLMLGDKKRATQEVERALASLPVSRDAFDGALNLRLATALHANAGAEERAVADLERLMQLPGGSHVEELKVDPLWDPLRANPRFQKLIADNTSR